MKIAGFSRLAPTAQALANVLVTLRRTADGSAAASTASGTDGYWEITLPGYPTGPYRLDSLRSLTTLTATLEAQPMAGAVSLAELPMALRGFNNGVVPGMLGNFEPVLSNAAARQVTVQPGAGLAGGYPVVQYAPVTYTLPADAGAYVLSAIAETATTSLDDWEMAFALCAATVAGGVISEFRDVRDWAVLGRGVYPPIATGRVETPGVTLTASPAIVGSVVVPDTVSSPAVQDVWASFEAPCTGTAEVAFSTRPRYSLAEIGSVTPYVAGTGWVGNATALTANASTGITVDVVAKGSGTLLPGLLTATGLERAA